MNPFTTGLRLQRSKVAGEVAERPDDARSEAGPNGAVRAILQHSPNAHTLPPGETAPGARPGLLLRLRQRQHLCLAKLQGMTTGRQTIAKLPDWTESEIP